MQPLCKTKIIGVLAYIVANIYRRISSSVRTMRKASLTDESEDEKQKESGENTTESTQLEINVVDSKEPMNFFKQKPNFFLAFQVNSVEIHKKVKELQERLIAKNPLLFPALIEVSTLHVTLAVTYLANKTDVETVKNKLDEWAEKNKKIFFGEPCTVTFVGVKTFNNVVAYVDLDQCSNYKRVFEISNSLNNLLSSAGFSVDKKSFTPHLTFLKLSKDFKLLKLKKHFKEDFEILRSCKELFGKQEITSLQFLSMDEPKDEAGYYKCYHQIKLSDVQLNMDHSKCCSPILKPKALAKEEYKNIFQCLKQKKE